MRDTRRFPASLPSLLLGLWHHVSRRRRSQFALLLILTLASAVAEVFSLGAVVPFIGILTQPTKVFAYPALASVIRTLGITSPAGLILPLSVAFAGAAIVAGALRLLLLWVSIRLSNATGADLSIEVYRRTLYQPYEVHVARSTSDIISGITQKVSTATTVLLSAATVATSLVLFLAIITTLFAVDPVIAGAAIAAFGSGYLLTAVRTRRRLVENSRGIADDQSTVIKVLQEGLGAIRDVLLDDTQALYCRTYATAIRRQLAASGENSYISQAPRYGMETLGMVLVAVLAVLLSKRPGGIGAALPTLAALGLGAQRLLPLLQQLYNNWSVVAGSHGSLADVLALLEQPLPETAGTPAPAPLAFTEAIVLQSVGFRYASGPRVLHDLDLVIPRGARVGFVGTTGSGKSTTLDVLMGLLRPTEGQILIDGAPLATDDVRRWQRSLAHVPQNIYLADATIAENIAFGLPPQMIDLARVRRAAERAQLASFIESRPDGYETMVGERGIRLSGGQRQRIAIARALYKQASVLVFDEATSALDTETEDAVMAAIGSLDRDLTILLIAHRVSTLKGCDFIVRLEAGRIVARGAYADFESASHPSISASAVRAQQVSAVARDS